jgi:hypothetical protein
MNQYIPTFKISQLDNILSCTAISYKTCNRCIVRAFNKKNYCKYSRGFLSNFGIKRLKHESWCYTVYKHIQTKEKLKKWKEL